MAQADYNIAANPSGLNLRTEANAIFSAILSNNSGSVAPTVTTAFMMWVDTSNATYYYLKMRNHDNTAWVTLFTYTVSTKVIEAYTENTVKLTESQSVGGVKTFTSSPIVPTPTNTTDVANKAYVDTKANLASPTFTGIPTAPTASVGTNTTQLATTAFVLANAVNVANFAKSLAANGYQKIIGGLIIQWGSASVTARSSDAKINLPIAFPNAALFAIASGKGGNTLFNGGEVVTSWSTTQIGVSTYDGTAVTWIAIGY